MDVGEKGGRCVGVVKKWMAEKEFGFIIPDSAYNRVDIFFHKSAVRDGRQVEEGDKVEYDEAPGRKAGK